MSQLNFDYVPLTFISDPQQIRQQIRFTLILIHLFGRYNRPTRLENLLESTQYGYIASAQATGQNKFLRISDIHGGKVNWDTVPFCDCDDEKTYVLKKDDILVARTGGTTGKCFKIDVPAPGAVFAGYLIRLRVKETVSPDYVYFFLNSYAYWSQIVNLNERNFRPKANAENLKALLIPDCPKHIQDDAIKLAQGEVVTGYELLVETINQVLADYEKTQEISTLFEKQLELVGQLQQAILQDAVQGTLTAQWRTNRPFHSGEETGVGLLAQIRAEKAERIRAKKLNGATSRKEKPLPPITDAEKPFDLPEGWVWCRLGEVIELISGQHIDSSDYNESQNGFPYITGPADFGDQYPIPTKWTSRPKVFAQEGDMLITVKGSGVGKMNTCHLKDLVISRQLMAIRTVIASSQFVSLFLNQSYDKLQGDKKGTGIPGIGREHIIELLIPLPPLAEQQAIVAAVERALGQVGQLRAALASQRETAGTLLKALLHRAFSVGEVVEEEATEKAVY